MSKWNYLLTSGHESQRFWSCSSLMVNPEPCGTWEGGLWRIAAGARSRWCDWCLVQWYFACKLINLYGSWSSFKRTSHGKVKGVTTLKPFKILSVISRSVGLVRNSIPLVYCCPLSFRAIVRGNIVFVFLRTNIPVRSELLPWGWNSMSMDLSLLSSHEPSAHCWEAGKYIKQKSLGLHMNGIAFCISKICDWLGDLRSMSQPITEISFKPTVTYAHVHFPAFITVTLNSVLW